MNKNDISLSDTEAALERSSITDDTTQALAIDVPKSLLEFGFDFDSKGLPFKNLDVDLTPVGDRDFFGESLNAFMHDHLESLGIRQYPLKTRLDHRHPTYFGTFYGTEEFKKMSTVLLLIPGSGRLGCGVWSRTVLEKQGIARSTMESYIKEGQRLGWGVVIAEPNKTFVWAAGRKVDLINSLNAKDHLANLFECYLFHTKVETIHVVAHRDASDLIEVIIDRNRTFDYAIRKIKHVCLLGGSIKNIVFPRHAPFITTWSQAPFSLSNRNINFTSKDVLLWPYRSVFSVFHVLLGGSVDKAQKLIDAVGPAKEEVEEEPPLFDDPLADWI